MRGRYELLQPPFDPFFTFIGIFWIYIRRFGIHIGPFSSMSYPIAEYWIVRGYGGASVVMTSSPLSLIAIADSITRIGALTP